MVIIDPVSRMKSAGFCVLSDKLLLMRLIFVQSGVSYIFDDRSNWAATMNGSFASGSDGKIPIMGAVNLNE